MLSAKSQDRAYAVWREETRQQSAVATNARRPDHACARCSRPTLLGRIRGEAATYCPFATFGHAPDTIYGVAWM